MNNNIAQVINELGKLSALKKDEIAAAKLAITIEINKMLTKREDMTKKACIRNIRKSKNMSGLNKASAYIIIGNVKVTA